MEGITICMVKGPSPVIATSRKREGFGRAGAAGATATAAPSEMSRGLTRWI
jgi:hypothetical protein